MRAPQIQIANPGPRILGRNNNAALGAILRNRVELPQTADIVFPNTGTGPFTGPLVGAVLAPVDPVHDSYEFSTTLALLANAAETLGFTVKLFTGAFTVNGLAPVPGVYYGDGTVGHNAFAGGTATELFTGDLQFDATELNAILDFAFLAVPGIATPFVGIAATITVPSSGTATSNGSPSAPAGTTYMREMP